MKPLFKCTSVDGKTTEDPHNFSNAPGVITLIRNMGGGLKVWEHLDAARSAFEEIQMVQFESPELSKM